ncbi:MAG: DUF87 domain-containing protein [Deltaproteobacteria bacterium]|nr:DUF87 domain-containing protein [Deltaproteobacteria bacterium]
MFKPQNDKNPITPFAITDYRDIRRRFGIKEKNRRGHMYIIGKTGTGKTTLIENMIISDIKAGNGLAIIDPHGDLAEHLLNFIPKRRIDEVIYFNPSDLNYPMAFNPLEKVDQDHHHLVASGLISVFKKIWFDSWGPRMEHILRNAILSLLDYPGSTLLDIPLILVDKDFRKKVLEKVSNPQVKDFWLTEFERYSSYFRSEAISPIQNKVGHFLSTPLIRNIVGQAQSSMDFRKIMDEGKVLIVNLSKGKIGEDNCSLLGAMIVTKIQLAAVSRGDMPENRRKSFYLYVDEVHNFLTLSFADILSEARKYGLSLVLAHQYIEQLDEKIRSAIFGNVGTLIAFRVGARDAQFLKNEFSPVFDETDLVHLPNYRIYLKLLIDGVTSRPFSAITLPPFEIRTSHKNKVIETSRTMFARIRVEVEREIMVSRVLESRPTGRQMRFL